MYPKFDGIKAYRCSPCNVVFGIDNAIIQVSCPKCKGEKTELVGEGMMMFYPLPQHPVEKEELSTNLDKDGYPVVLKASHIAEIVGISKRLAYELMERKDFPLIRLGRMKRANRDEFFKWFEGNM
jgi:hypothetical protein